MRLPYLKEAIVELPLCFLPSNYRLCAGYARSQGRRYSILHYLPLVASDFAYVASGRRAADEFRDAEQDMLNNAY